MRTMKDLKILVVDDELEFLTALKERLSLRGAYTEGAFTGYQALLKITMKEFDVILMDYKMPGLSGIELLRKIKEIRPEIKVILITGYGSEQLGDEGMKEGAYCFFTKPVDINALVEKLRECIPNGEEPADD